MSRYEGACQLDGMGVCGWARDTETSTPIWVEVLVDTVVVGITRASMREPKGCGFWLALPPQALEEGREVRVRVANADADIGVPLLLGATAPAEKPQTKSGLQGEMTLDRGLCLVGWVQDAARPEQRLRVTARVAGEPVATALAECRHYRPEESDGHSFVLHLPATLADGETHQVTVQTDDQRDVPGSPVVVRVWPESVADWMEARAHPDEKERTLEIALVRHMEARVSGVVVDYAAWATAFPVPRPQGKVRCTWDFPKGLERLASGQKGVDGKPGHGKGDVAVLLREGESLHPLTLAHGVRTLRDSGAALLYADSERDGKPLFRPCFDADRFWGADYLGPLLATRRLMAAVPQAQGEDYWAWRVRLVRQALEQGGVWHLPLVLSHDLPVPSDNGRQGAVADWVQTLRPGTLVEPCGDVLRVRWPRQPQPAVTVIIPTRDRADLLRPCLKSLYTTDYGPLDILIVDNGTQEPTARRLLRAAALQPRTRVMPYPGPFNYAAMNNAAVHEATGAYVCFLNNDTEAIHPDWLAEMVAQLAAQGERAGAVGAKLLWPNGLVQHAGVLVGTQQLASHIGNQWMDEEPGYLDNNRLAVQRSAVTAACLLTPRALFLALGGFDATSFPVAFNDVDYCLRVRAAGKKIVWTPWARLWHKESASRGADTSPMDQARMRREIRSFRQRWGAYEDPFYNPNLPLSTVSEPFEGLALPPRHRHPQQEHPCCLPQSASSTD